jgi:hypothetical protein
MRIRWVCPQWGWIVLACAAGFLGGCEAPPHQPGPRAAPTVVYPAPAPAYGYSDIRRCRTDNQRIHAEVLSLFDQARAAGRISPNEAQRFNEMDGRVRAIAFQLERDGLSMDECVYIRNSLEQNRIEVLRMSRSDPAVGRCMADNRRVHQDTVALYENARNSGRINPAEAQRFQAMEARLNNLRRDLARDGISLQDCRILANTLARDQEDVARMSRYDPGVGRCTAENRATHEATIRTYNDGARAGRIDAAEAARFHAIEQRLAGFQSELKRDGLSLQDCQRLARAIARERALVDAMVK